LKREVEDSVTDLIITVLQSAPGIGAVLAIAGAEIARATDRIFAEIEKREAAADLRARLGSRPSLREAAARQIGAEILQSNEFKEKRRRAASRARLGA